MSSLRAKLAALPALPDDEISRGLIDVWVRPTGTSTAGFPYLQRDAWEYFRDRVPHLFRMGAAVLARAAAVEQALGELSLGEQDVEHLRRALRVTRQVVLTAAVTAPPDLWLLRQVLGFFAELGLLSRLLDGEALYPEHCRVRHEGREQLLQAQELDTDLHFLLSRGIVEQYDDGFRVAGHPRVRAMLQEVGPLPPRAGHPTQLWRRLFAGEDMEDAAVESLLELVRGMRRRDDPRQNHWVPTLAEVELGYLLVPIVLALRANELTASREEGQLVTPEQLSLPYVAAATAALEVLTACGWLERQGAAYRVTALGARGFSRGPGPFGIIETYHPYMSRGAEILLRGRGQIWVRRGENVGASQDANAATFKRANDALDRFCEETGFRFRVFIEHAIGRGEATRQRYERAGAEQIVYFGADLEDDAIDAATREQAAGHLPPNMVFVRNADIGKPAALLEAIRAAGCDPYGAVMLVGNGFHEVRDQTDEGMVEVFRGYHDAGIVLIFTEESALSIDDLRATAFNTYHAGFKYVHEKSGQGLRPAEPDPRPNRLGHPLRASWSQCAQAAGYVRADKWCTRTRTIYPYTPPSGFNPSVSVNHFFVPGPIAAQLGLTAR